MFSKAATVLMGLFLCSWCLAADGLPDPNNWFIQPLGMGYSCYTNGIQVSDSYVVFCGYDGTRYYDGTGIYELRYNGSTCREASVSDSSIVSATSGGIAFHYLGYRYLYEVSDAYYGYPDVYTQLPVIRVVWQAGPDLDNTQVYFDNGSERICLTDNDQCFHNGKFPKVSADTAAWLSNDGHDDEVFVYKDGVITQLTYNDVDEFDLRMADNGDMAWSAWDFAGPLHGHYYDGQHIRQLSVGDSRDEILGISEMGVLYYQDHFDSGPSLVLYDGTQETVLFETEETGNITGASIGGNSTAWIGQKKWNDDMSVFLLKGEELISWSIPFAWTDSVGVWGNRLVWAPENDNLYFGEYLGSPICANRPIMDGNDDCNVDLLDFAIFAGEWLTCGYDDPAACH